MSGPPELAPNRFPLPREEALLRADLAGAQEERDRAERNLQLSLAEVEDARRKEREAEQAYQAAQEARATAESLHAQAVAASYVLDDRMLRIRSRLHPIRRTPADVLDEIFQHVVEANDAAASVAGDNEACAAAQRAPFRLAATCRSWRAAALARPRLWQSLRLDMTAVFLSLCRVHGAGIEHDEPCEDCRWCLFIRTHLERSGRMPIDLQLVGSIGLRAPRLLHIWRLLAEATPRVRSLAIKYGDGPGRGLELLLQNHMPVLETFAIDCTPAPGDGRHTVLRAPFFESAPRLRDCRLRDFAPALRGALFPALQTLQWVSSIAHGDAAPVRVVHQLLYYCRGVKRLALDVVRLEDDGSDQVAYPGVEDLSFVVKNPDANAAIESFVFPRAARLHVSLAPGRSTRAMVQSCSATLTTLVITLKGLAASFAAVLTGASRLESVEFVKCKLTEGLFRELTTPLADVNNRLPAWRRLHIDQCSVPQTDPFTGDGFLHLIRLRNEGGADRCLSDVAVSWKDYDDVPLRPGFEAELQALLQ